MAVPGRLVDGRGKEGSLVDGRGKEGSLVAVPGRLVDGRGKEGSLVAVPGRGRQCNQAEGGKETLASFSPQRAPPVCDTQ